MAGYKEGKIRNLQALRGLAVLLVICTHIKSNEAKYGHGYTILPDLLNIGHSGVDLFFVISGFVMNTVTRDCFQNLNSIYRFVYHRITRIYPIYWFYSLLMLAIFLAQSGTGNARVVDITSSFLLLPQKELPLLVVGWTLIHEMYFYLVFAFLLIFREHWLLPLLLIWGCTSTISHFISSANPAIQLITHPLTLEFIFGSLVALFFYSRKLSMKVPKYFGWALFIIAIIWWLLAYITCVHLEFFPELYPWIRLLVFGLPAALLVYAMVVLESYSDWHLPAWLVSIGDASFTIYLSHLLVIATIGRIWEKFNLVGFWINGSIVMMMFCSILTFGLVGFRFIESPLLKFTRRLYE